MQQSGHDIFADADLVLEAIADDTAVRYGREIQIIKTGIRQLQQPRFRRRRQALVVADADDHVGRRELHGRQLRFIAVFDLDQADAVAEMVPQQVDTAASDGAMEQDVHIDRSL